MTHAKRARWLLERRSEWSGLSSAEVVEDALSPRVESLVVRMRDEGLFPELWSEEEVLVGFLGAVAEARLLHRQAYARQVRLTEGECTFGGQRVVAFSPRLLGPRA